MVTIERMNSLIDTLKLPDSIKDLPKFTGNKHSLHEFIKNVDEIVKQCDAILGSGQIPTTFLRAIRNKIVGEADEVLTMYGTNLDWNSIKDNLRTHYADKRNETSLIRDLHTIYQGLDTVEKYFSKIIDVQSTIINHVRLHENNEIVKSTKENLYREMCLSTFLAGLREPMGSMIRARNPENIAEAFSLCVSEQNMHYIKNRVINSGIPNSIRKSLPIQVQQPNYQHKLQYATNYFAPRQNNPNNNYNPRPSFVINNQSSQRYQNNHSNPPYYNLQRPQNLQTKIEPMDTTSNINKFQQPTRFNKQDTNKWLNRNPQNQSRQQEPPRFVSEELYNVEGTNNDEQIYEEIEYPSQYVPDLDSFKDPNEEEPNEKVFSATSLRTPTELISLNTHQSGLLPYIHIAINNKTKLKMLIDTGANKSFIDPAYLNPKRIQKIQPITVRTLFQNHEITEKIIIKGLQEFGTEEPLEFFSFKFHEYFDGLIGLEIIQQLGIRLDFQKSLLETDKVKIPLLFKPNCASQFYNIPARAKQIIQIPVDTEEGEFYIKPIQTQNNLIIPEGIYRAKNWRSTVEIANFTDQDQPCLFEQPIKTESLKNYHTEINHSSISMNTQKSQDITNLIRVNHLNIEEEKAIKNLCLDYEKIFLKENQILTFTNRIKHQIDLRSDKPIFTKSYRYPHIHKEEMKNQIDKMLQDGIIRPSYSPWSSPIWIVPKKVDASGKTKWRLVIDYRKLNEQTIDDRYPLPNITEILDKLG